MKSLALLLIASLAVNGFLLSRMVRIRAASPAPTAGEESAKSSARERPAETFARSDGRTPGATKAGALDASRLAAVLGGDLQSMIAQLEAAGLSPEVVRA